MRPDFSCWLAIGIPYAFITAFFTSNTVSVFCTFILSTKGSKLLNTLISIVVLGMIVMMIRMTTMTKTSS